MNDRETEVVDRERFAQMVDDLAFAYEQFRRIVEAKTLEDARGYAAYGLYRVRKHNPLLK